MSQVKSRSAQGMSKRKVLRCEYFWSNHCFYLQSEKTLGMFDGRNRPFRVCACARHAEALCEGGCGSLNYR